MHGVATCFSCDTDCWNNLQYLSTLCSAWPFKSHLQDESDCFCVLFDRWLCSHQGWKDLSTKQAGSLPKVQMVGLTKQEGQCVMRRRHQAKQQSNPSTRGRLHSAPKNKPNTNGNTTHLWSHLLPLQSPQAQVLQLVGPQGWSVLEPLSAGVGDDGPRFWAPFHFFFLQSLQQLFILSSSFHAQDLQEQLFSLSPFIFNFARCRSSNSLDISSSSASLLVVHDTAWRVTLSSFSFWSARALFQQLLTSLSFAQSHHSENVVCCCSTGIPWASLSARPVRLFLVLLVTTPTILRLTPPALPSCVLRGGTAHGDLTGGTLGHHRERLFGWMRRACFHPSSFSRIKENENKIKRNMKILIIMKIWTENEMNNKRKW